MMQGIDISNYQKTIKLSGLKGLDFVIIKATQGTGYINPSLKAQTKQAVDMSIPYGFYHYASQGGAEKEAQHFIDVVKDHIGKSILVLDWETESNPNFKNPKYAKAFLDYVKEKTGVTPFIYMSKSVCRQFSWNETAALYPLWAAQYKNKNITGWQKEPWTDSKGYGAWERPLIFQYSSKGRIEGYNGDLDLDISYITKDMWKSYAGAGYDQKSTKTPDNNTGSAQITRTLKKGCKGEDVKWLQTNLNLRGYFLEMDGIFGEKTLRAVMDFQKKNGLTVDGLVGKATIAALMK